LSSKDALNVTINSTSENSSLAMTTTTTTTTTTEVPIDDKVDKMITSGTSIQGSYSTSTNKNEVSPSETSNEPVKEEDDQE
jgi:hypothetical protein